MAKKSITGGASFQSILLQSDSTQIENIGIAIYQMHRYYSVSGVVKDHVIEYFLNNIIGNKDKLKEAIAKEAFLQNDKTTTSFLGMGPFLSSTSSTLPRRKKTISLAETIPEISQDLPRLRKLNSDSEFLTKKERNDGGSLPPLVVTKSNSSSRLLAVLNETKQITSTVTENIYLNLVNGNPLTTTDIVVITLGSVVIGITFGFVLGVSFTSLIALIAAKLLI